MRRLHFVQALATVSMLAVGASAASLEGCGDDSTAVADDASTPDQSVADTATPQNDSGTSDTGTDTGNDTGTDSNPSGPVTYTIPAGGGSATVTGASTALTFNFPASAAGKTVTLTPSAAPSGWASGTFSDVIAMTPAGTTFSDPVIVKPSNQEVIVLDLVSGTTQGPAEGLPLNATGDGVLLRHFSTLVIVPAGKTCDSASGWSADPDAGAGACADAGTATTSLWFGCKGYNFCMFISASCCAAPGSTSCHLGDPNLLVSYTPNNGNGGSYPYCTVDAGPGSDGGTCMPETFAFAANGGCTVQRSCSGVAYNMACDGTTCTCTKSSATTATFSQQTDAGASVCHDGAQMTLAYAQSCGYPNY